MSKLLEINLQIYFNLMQLLKKLLFLLSANEKKSWVISNNDLDIIIFGYARCSINNALLLQF